MTDQLSNVAKVLTIGGSDSGGGAGIQADLKTFTCHQMYGTSVITCVTAQNTLGVHGIHPIPQEFVTHQLDAVLSDIGTNAIKTGALCNSEIIKSVVHSLKTHYPNIKASNSNLVVDPVMVSTSGHSLLTSDAEHTMVTKLFPITYILTPNIPEAQKILQHVQQQKPIRDLEHMKLAAIELGKLGPEIILVKGGHIPFHKCDGHMAEKNELEDVGIELVVIDLLYNSGTNQMQEIKHDFIRTRNTHGTGCTLSAAIAANLATGNFNATESILKAIEYVQSAIRSSFSIQKNRTMTSEHADPGFGPLNHFHGILQRGIEQPSESNPHPFMTHLLRKYSQEWEAYIKHPFVQGIANGHLPRQNFIHYIKQDYIFLQNYARAHALSSYKSKSLKDSRASAQIVVSIADETNLHVDFCSRWGVTLEELENTRESMANVAYTRYVLDIGLNGDLLDLELARAPCLIGYGYIGKWIMKDSKSVKGPENVYWDWICNYDGNDYQSAVRTGIEKLEQLAQEQEISSNRLKNLEKIFLDTVLLETAFWDMGMNRS